MALHKSLDDGTSWSIYRITSESNPGTAVAVDQNSDNIIYAGGIKGIREGVVFKSIDGGMSWTEIGKGVISGLIREIVVDKTSTNKIYVGTSDGLYKSNDYGISWNKIFSSEVKDVKINPNSPNEIFIAGVKGIFTSLDFGGTWSEYDQGLSVLDVNSIEINFEDRIFYAGTSGASVYRNQQKEQRLIYPPLDFSGERVENRSLFLVEYIDVLSWKKNPVNVDIAKYRICLAESTNLRLLTEVDANTFEYKRRKVSNLEDATYMIVAVEKTGRRGGAAYTTIKKNVKITK